MKRQIEKSDGNGNTFLVDDPDQFNEEGFFKKKRSKQASNITKAKKKRKRKFSRR
jgi:hypothetical protein